MLTIPDLPHPAIFHLFSGALRFGESLLWGVRLSILGEASADSLFAAGFDVLGLVSFLL